MHRSRGFTLIEILVTLFILMIVGILITTGLNSVVRAHHLIEKKSKSLMAIQLTLMRLEDDLATVSNKRMVTDKQRDMPAFIASKNAIEFSRAEMINAPNVEPHFQRVHYQLQNGMLMRLTKSKTAEILLKNVKSFHCHLIPKSNVLSNTALQNKTSSNPIRDIGIIIDIEIADLGHIKRIIPLAINDIEDDTNAPST